ncbi:related to Sentrin-specific protease 1 [Melanopsichium pennsylvanicum]|uniref:Related to Sentrin-specific protease 1 n=2 Tax=Melanopsichium pennsylvanicum TaxID=63383 RepID=A0AAJ4XH74_9BASI|nr:related to Sentrin-specific protease 1 [Melanopsichium pennsylvanicum 4]SNX81671.1 related to Sentrin-specific protease 1 [Melanopsichium pennsylvanicum]
MPDKRRRQPLESTQHPTNAAASSSASLVSSNASASSASAFKPASPFKRLINYIKGPFTPSPRKRQRLDARIQNDTRLMLNFTATPQSSTSSLSAALPMEEISTSPASGFVDLTPSKATSSISNTRSILPSQEGAIRDPLARTCIVSTSSPSSAPMTDKRSLLEEAAKMHIQHAYSPSNLASTCILAAAASDTDMRAYVPSERAEASAGGDAVATQVTDAAKDALHTAGTFGEQPQPEEIEDAAAAPSETMLIADNTSQGQAIKSDAEDVVEKTLVFPPGSRSDNKLEGMNEEPAATKDRSVNNIPTAQDLNEYRAPEHVALEAAKEEATATVEPEAKVCELVAESETAVPNTYPEHVDGETAAQSPDGASDAESKSEHECSIVGPIAEHSVSSNNTQLDDAANDDIDSVEKHLRTDTDVDHIQLMADAKVGEHVEGLLDWSKSLDFENRHPPSAPASVVAEDSEGALIPLSQEETLAQGNTEGVINLISDSEDDRDQDKENDVSLINAIPQINSDATLPSLADQDSLQISSRASRPRFSLVGPMAQNARQLLQGSAKSPSSTPLNGFASSDTSATEEIRSIGRQSRFFAPKRAKAVQSSTPQPTRPSPVRNRRSSLSSDVSMSSASAVSNHTSFDSIYRKRNPIFQKQHVRLVGSFNTVALQRRMDIAVRKIQATQSSKRRLILKPKHIYDLAVKSLTVREIIAADNRQKADAEGSLTSLIQKLERQKKDAQAVLPLPQVKLTERERLKREERAKAKRLRGVLGRKPLPQQLEVEQDRKATAVFSTRGRIADIPGASVDDKDVQKLRPGQWLNDEVINFYGNLILQRANDADKRRTEATAMAASKAASFDTPRGKTVSKNGKVKISRPYDQSLDAFWRVHFFSSFFWTNLKSRGFDGVKRWTRRIDIFSKDLILFPINLGNAHWVCGAINMRKHRFEYYDSLGHSNEAAFNLMHTYITEEAKDKKKKEIDLRGWKNLFGNEDSPQQENGFDCGVFAAQTLEQISRRDPHSPIPLAGPSITWKGESLDEGAGRLNINGGIEGEDDDDDYDEEYEWNFSQENMPYLRKRMVYEIFAKQLLD